jgi:hypothetical protein
MVMRRSGERRQNSGPPWPAREDLLGPRVVGAAAEAVDRLRRENLIPPVAGVEQDWSAGKDTVLVIVRTPIDAQLTARVAEALVGISYELRQVSPTHAIDYRTC